MKRLLAVLAAACALVGCGSSYDAYRASEPRYDDDGTWEATRDTPTEAGGRARVRPGAQVIYSSEYQGGVGPGSYGGRSSTVITPRDDGWQVDSESYGR